MKDGPSSLFLSCVQMHVWKIVDAIEEQIGVWICGHRSCAKTLRHLNAGQQAGPLLLQAVVFYAALKFFNHGMCSCYMLVGAKCRHSCRSWEWVINYSSVMQCFCLCMQSSCLCTSGQVCQWIEEFILEGNSGDHLVQLPLLNVVWS